MASREGEDGIRPTSSRSCLSSPLLSWRAAQRSATQRNNLFGKLSDLIGTNCQLCVLLRNCMHACRRVSLLRWKQVHLQAHRRSTRQHISVSSITFSNLSFVILSALFWALAFSLAFSPNFPIHGMIGISIVILIIVWTRLRSRRTTHRSLDQGNPYFIISIGNNVEGKIKFELFDEEPQKLVIFLHPSDFLAGKQNLEKSFRARVGGWRLINASCRALALALKF